jgi:FlaA1/EpsC-like NDP-sugar epimerase
MHRFRNRHFFLLDLAVLVAAAYLSFVLRLERFHPDSYFPAYILFTTVILVVFPILFRRMGIYARYWQYASIDEMMLLTGTVTLMTLIVTVIAYPLSSFFFNSYPVPRSIPLIFLLLALAFTAGPRLIARSTSRLKQGMDRRNRTIVRPVLIVGAGQAGKTIAHELLNNPQLGLDAVGFLDDNPAKGGIKILGIPVLGSLATLPRILASHNIQQVIIAMPTAPGKVVRNIRAVCETHQVQTRIIPGLYELIDGTVNIHKLRDVKIEDLLRRDPIQSDIAPVQALLTGKRVMVSGGGGSIGSELCRQIAHCAPERLIILDHAENSLYYILNELKGRHPTLRLDSTIADVRNRADLDKIYAHFQPDVVFHAAAHKHVPLMEANPSEAVTNNVKGTRNLVELAAAHGVEQFVMISTDKAVNPTSVMGATKRTAERIVQSVAKATGRPYVAVRFGNVLGSSGSVVPLFQQQIAAGGPVTVTHPDMTRFFMTIPEAVQLVLQAATLGKGKEVFVLDMGEPVKILDLAHDLITLSGLRPGEDIEITFTGMRPGEKLYEELVSDGEIYIPTRHSKIRMLRDTNGFNPVTLFANIETLVAAAEARNDEAIRPLLKVIVPDYLYGEPHKPLPVVESPVIVPAKLATRTPTIATAQV